MGTNTLEGETAGDIAVHSEMVHRYAVAQDVDRYAIAHDVDRYAVAQDNQQATRRNF